MVRAPALALAALLALGGCSGGGGADVRLGAVARARVTEVVEAPGTVTARAVATVNAPADGSIGEIRVADGEQVRQGQVLLRIESPAARRALRQAERADARAAAAGGGAGVPVTLAGAQQADAQAARAFRRAERAARDIPDREARSQALAALRVSRSQYEAARAAADQAAASLAAGLGTLSRAVSALSSAQRVQTRAAIDVARRTVRALTVRAPLAGTVSLSAPGTAGESAAGGDLLSQLPEALRSQAGSALGGAGGGASVTASVVEGAPVGSGQPLVTVTDTSTLSLTASVDETDVLLVEPGTGARAELDAVTGASYAATVTTVDPTPTTSTRGGVSYVVRLSLGPGRTRDGEVAPLPRPGMSAVVDLLVREVEAAVSVPVSAVFRDGDRDAVWVVKNDEARSREVRLGAQGEDRVEVLEGLEVGERIVVRGADRVRAGQSLS